MGTTVRELFSFLEEAELSQYYNSLTNDLKITTIPQLKYVEEDDLLGIGMTKPEMRRLKRHYKKECPQGALGRLKKAILSKTSTDGPGRSLSPSPPENRSSTSHLSSYIRPPSRQIIPADSIAVSKTLGEGEFGVVQQGIWTTENGEKVQVAIKCLSKERLQNGTTEFLKEASIMQTIDHENIVRMFGVVLDKENSLMLVTELAPMRSLLECLKEQSLRLDFPLSKLCDFAHQVCDGMSYLESKRLIHRDLAARNILVFSKIKVKISDFGLSRALGVGKDYYQSNFSINLKLPIAWCAPECINYLKFTSSSDAWAFGVVLWELFSYGFQPWAGMTGQQILEAIDSPVSQRLDRPDLCPKEHYDLMLKCWNHEPDKRPTFSEMLLQLPIIRPTQMKATKDFPEITVPKDFLYYKASDIIYVIDKKPANAPAVGLCRGVLNNGKAGFFDPVNCVPVIEPRSSPITSVPKPTSLMRKESKRNSTRKLRADMISGPQNDLRHTGHIGYDGAVFGDVSFIGDNYDKLPLNTSGSMNKLNDENRLSYRHSPDKSSPGSPSMNGTSNGLGHSWISQESIDSSFTIKDDADGSDKASYYQDIEDDSIFSDFKMPDISTSFDFGPSFMDEVLKALNEKEAKLSASSDNDTTPSPMEVNRNSFGEKERSVSPPKEVKATPPPLPAQPPRTESRREPPKPEPRKQAKVKPMSAAEQKMMDDAIALANECVTPSPRIMMDQPSFPSSHVSGERDSDSGADSPKLISKIKKSIKRSSPKLERKRTFSEEIAHKGEIDEDVPPEAQEAYNMLVVRGSVKEEEKKAPPPQRPSKILERESSPDQRRSYGLNSFRSNSEQINSYRPSAEKTSFRSSFDQPSITRSNVPLADTEEVDLFVDLEPEPKPVPKPRVEIPAKRSEIPVPAPKPKPEVHRVDPVPRPQQPPPRVPVIDHDLNESFGSNHSFGSSHSYGKDSYKSGSDIHELRIHEDRDVLDQRPTSLNSSGSDFEDPKKQIDVLRIDLPDSMDYKKDSSPDYSAKDLHIEEISRRDSSSKSSSLFDEEFSEPSPREIMNKLARESRIRRSLDHQRALSSDFSDSAPNRNLREPQGIPGKSLSSSNGGDDEEVDTNPLRMLRGGAIPIRGGRTGQGMASQSNRAPRAPKLPLKQKHILQHSMSVDTGTVQHVNGISSVVHDNVDVVTAQNENLTYTNNKPPAVPPRCNSVCDDGTSVGRNLLPLPPRQCKPRPGSLTSTPRQRKYPLVLDDDDRHEGLSSSRQSSVLSSCTVAAIGDAAPTSNAWTPPVPSRLGRPSYLPPAPPPPSSHVNNAESYCDNNRVVDDDNVFESNYDQSPPLKPRRLFSDQKCISYNQNESSGSSTFPRRKFGIHSVKCNLEQLGYYNRHDPFWVKSLYVAGERLSDRGSSEEVSPLMLASYKSTSEGVSYEDLLDLALDRQKNCEEIETMLKIFGSEVGVEDCMKALEETKWDILRAVKFIKLKQLLSTQIGDANLCKEALMACDWDVQRAANYMLTNPLPSPECIDV